MFVLLARQNGDNSMIVGVFSTLEKAISQAKLSDWGLFIYEIELDETFQIESEINKRMIWSRG